MAACYAETSCWLIILETIELIIGTTGIYTEISHIPVSMCVAAACISSEENLIGGF
jgi:hypothetical protein